MQGPPIRPDGADCDRFGESLATTGASRELDRHLEDCAACREARAGYARLDALMASSAIAVSPELAVEVMRSLPPAGWEGRSPRAWRLPIAVALVLAGASVLLASFGSGGSGGSLVGALGAVGDLLATGALAATGMLWASWRGAGVALDGLLTPGGTAALVILVASVDLVLLTLLTRRPPRPGSPQAARAASRDGRRLR